MNSKRSFVVLGVLTVLCVITPIQGGAVGADHSPVWDSEAEVTSSGGIEYQISFQANQSMMVVEYRNPTQREVKFARYIVSADGQRVYENNINLSEGEQRTEKINITSGINVNQDKHTVTFSTFGGHTQFNFTREIESVDSGQIPTPYISDVTVTSGTIKGKASAVANVTLVNPSDQLYSTKLFVHTQGTDGSLYPASVRPGDSRTITVELLDERGSKIAGEARLYSGNLTTEDGAMDQVEFAGQAGEDTRIWNASYEPVRPTWMDSHYQYRNASYGQSVGEQVSGGHELAGVPLVYFGIAFVVGLAAVRKLR